MTRSTDFEMNDKLLTGGEFGNIILRPAPVNNGPISASFQESPKYLVCNDRLTISVIKYQNYIKQIIYSFIHSFLFFLYRVIYSVIKNKNCFTICPVKKTYANVHTNQ